MVKQETEDALADQSEQNFADKVRHIDLYAISRKKKSYVNILQKIAPTGPPGVHGLDAQYLVVKELDRAQESVGCGETVLVDARGILRGQKHADNAIATVRFKPAVATN